MDLGGIGGCRLEDERPDGWPAEVLIKGDAADRAARDQGDEGEARAGRRGESVAPG